jgi:indolepyruvate ferredoxin oxidoreductase beta subunit
VSKRLEPLFRKGRHVTTTHLRWFLLLSAVAGMRRWRRSTLKYEREQARIEAWLDLVRSVAPEDQEAAAELVECQRLIKGYSETFARGVANYDRIIQAYNAVRGRPDAAAIVRRLREAALADDEAKALGSAIADLRLAS